MRSRISSASETNSRYALLRGRLLGRRGAMGLTVPPLRQELAHDPPQGVGLEGLHEVRVRAKPESLFAVPFGTLRRHDDERNAAVRGVALHKREQLESVDVRHVDIGQDEVEGLTRQEAK